MKIPAGAASFCPPVLPLSTYNFRGSSYPRTFRPNGTNDWLLIYTVSGSGLYRFEGGEYQSRTGDITLYRPRTFHDYQISPTTRKWDMLLCHFLPRTDWLAWLRWPEITPGLMKLTLDEKAIRRHVVHRFKDVIRLAWKFEPQSDNFAMNALEEVLLWCDSINSLKASRQIDPRIQKAMDFLSVNLTKPYVEEEMAHIVGMSASRLRHLFQIQMKDSPRRFHEMLRLRRAKDLLTHSHLSISETASELGFENLFYFSLRFKKYTGENPRAFRHRINQQPDASRSDLNADARQPE